MSREALLAAVAADPGADLPRLVFADWLDDHGDADRAEFIRLQCATAAASPTDPDWLPRKLREYALFDRHRAEWATIGNGVSAPSVWRRGSQTSRRRGLTPRTVATSCSKTSTRRRPPPSAPACRLVRCDGCPHAGGTSG